METETRGYREGRGGGMRGRDGETRGGRGGVWVWEGSGLCKYIYIYLGSVKCKMQRHSSGKEGRKEGRLER